MRTTRHLLLCLLLPAVAAAAETAHDLLQQAERLRGRSSGYAEAIDLCKRALALPEITRDETLKACDIQYDIHARRRKRAEAIAAMEALQKALPDDDEADWTATSRILGQYWEWNKSDEGIACADGFLQRRPADKASCADAGLWKCRFLHRMQKYDEAVTAGETALALVPDDGKRMGDILWQMAESAWSANKLDQAETFVRHILEPKVFQQRNEWEQLNAQRRYGEVLDRLKRYDDACKHYLALEKTETKADVAQDWCLRAGRCLMAQQKYDDARKVIERVFTAHGSTINNWYSAQLTIASILQAQGKTLEALRATRIALDAAPNRSEITYRVRTIADYIRALDNNIGRANQFINYQRFGPAGEDGKPGTADDLTDPLPALGYPSYPERERAFDKVRKEAGDDDEASRLRAYTYIYTGKPKEALRHFLDMVGRVQSDRFKYVAPELIIVGVRAARGYAGDMQPFVDYVNYGPAGPDGRTGTADDLKDPFAPISK